VWLATTTNDSQQWRSYNLNHSNPAVELVGYMMCLWPAYQTEEEVILIVPDRLAGVCQLWYACKQAAAS